MFLKIYLIPFLVTFLLFLTIIFADEPVEYTIDKEIIEPEMAIIPASEQPG